jgi:glycerophosphoryl diester phosphodiesterase
MAKDLDHTAYHKLMKILIRYAVVLLTVMSVDAGTRVLVHGHRGARAMRPENTIPAFEYAIGIGADVLEMDVAVTKDNVLVISHDPHLNPVICQAPKPNALIRSLKFAEVEQYDCGALKNPNFPKQQPVPGTRIPSLDQVLSLSSQANFQYNIETKIFPEHPDYTPPPDVFAKMMLDLIRRHKLEARVILQSFDFRTLHAMKKLAPEIRRAALYEGKPRSFVEIAREAEANIISPEYVLVTPEQVKAAHAAGLEVVPWTANRPEDWDKLIAAGVDAIISDDPAALIAYLKKRGLR